MALSKLTLLSMVSITLFLGLAVLGWGGIVPFYEHTALLGLLVVSYAFGVIAGFSSGNISTGVREDKGNRWVLGVFFFIGLLVGYLPAYTDRIGFLTLGGEQVRWVGVVVYTIGCGLRIWPVFVLGKRFSGLVAIQPGHTLVTDGIYRTIRNPSYLGMILLLAGWALAFRSGVGLMIAASVLIPLVPRMNAEEKLLSSEFGGEYDAYRSRSWRLIPFVY